MRERLTRQWRQCGRLSHNMRLEGCREGRRGTTKIVRECVWMCRCLVRRCIRFLSLNDIWRPTGGLLCAPKDPVDRLRPRQTHHNLNTVHNRQSGLITSSSFSCSFSSYYSSSLLISSSSFLFSFPLTVPPPFWSPPRLSHSLSPLSIPLPFFSHHLPFLLILL